MSVYVFVVCAVRYLLDCKTITALMCDASRGVAARFSNGNLTSFACTNTNIAAQQLTKAHSQFNVRCLVCLDNISPAQIIDFVPFLLIIIMRFTAETLGQM